LIPRFAIVACLFALCTSAHAAMNAWLSQDAIGAGETVQLTLEHDGQTGSQPDLSPLARDFDIVARSSGSSIQINNGKMSSTAQLTLTLAPKHGGRLSIPVLRWDGQTTPALMLTVNGAASPSAAVAGGNSNLFITTTLEQKQPYVQAAVALTVRIYVDIPLSQASLDLPASSDVLVQQLGQDTQTGVTRNGQPYDMIERKYLLFPQKSGTLKFDGPVLEALMPDPRSTPFGNDPFFSRGPFAAMLNATRPVHLRGDPITLSVRPRPSNWNGRDWLPAQNVTLTETWPPDGGTLRAGSPITRRLQLRALGVTATQLPDLAAAMPLPPGLRAYPDQARLNTAMQGATVSGERTQDIALIASLPGHYLVPALHLAWWDTGKSVQREITLPARTLDVLLSAGGIAAMTSPPTQPTPPTTPPSVSAVSTLDSSLDAIRRHALSITAALGLITLGVLSVWGLQRLRRSARVKSPTPSTGSVPPLAAAHARAAFHRACRDNDAVTARRHLIEWAHAVWPDDSFAGLKGLVVRVADPALPHLLSELDRACYAGSEWRGDALLNALPGLSSKSPRATAKPTGLADLYP
jgi:hypothetical protein